MVAKILSLIRRFLFDRYLNKIQTICIVFQHLGLVDLIVWDYDLQKIWISLAIVISLIQIVLGTQVLKLSCQMLNAERSETKALPGVRKTYVTNTTAIITMRLMKYNESSRLGLPKSETIMVLDKEFWGKSIVSEKHLLPAVSVGFHEY